MSCSFLNKDEYSMKCHWPLGPVLVVVFLLAPSLGVADGFQGTAGYTTSDVGLYQNGSGFTAGWVWTCCPGRDPWT